MEKFLYCGDVERALYLGSMDGCADLLLGIKHHNRFLCRDSLEKFLHRGYMEKVLHRGSIEDCADSLLGIKYHNDSYTVEAWKCYKERNASEDYPTVKVFKKDPLGGNFN